MTDDSLFKRTSLNSLISLIAESITSPSHPQSLTHQQPESLSTRLGSIILQPAQLTSATLAIQSISRYHGVLLANAVGSGKTFTALAIAQLYHSIHVVAPAPLLAMWRSAIDSAFNDQSTRFCLHSLARFSRANPPNSPPTRRSLIVIDEAHHLRNSNTTRYRKVAQFVAGHDTVLLSATPMHNSIRDMQNMCALFAPPALLSAASLHKLVIRLRESDEVASLQAPHQQSNHSHPETSVRPQVKRHPNLSVRHAYDTLTLVNALPPPVPARDGAAAAALIKLGLLRAWSSSDAALDTALRRRILRGIALRDSIKSGRLPSTVELRAWSGDDDSIQLGFAELLVDHRSTNPSLAEQISRHLDALSTALTAHRNSGSNDSIRARLLKNVLDDHKNIPVIAFSQYRSTANAMFRQLRRFPGVAALTGSHGEIASGRVSRDELLGMFSPIAQGLSPPPPAQRVNLLITTDILAEGVNLQDAGVVVHLDLPWTAALLEQRLGRCCRIGSPHAVVHEYQFAPSGELARTLRLQERLALKGRLARHEVTGFKRQLSPPEARTRLIQELISISQVLPVSEGDTCPDTSPSHRLLHPQQLREPNQPVRVALCRTTQSVSQNGALVLLQQCSQHDELSRSSLIMIDGQEQSVSTSPSRLLALVRALRHQRDESCSDREWDATHGLRCQLLLIATNWIRERRLQACAGIHASASNQQVGVVDNAQKMINHVPALLPLSHRHGAAGRLAAIRERLFQLHGAAAIESVRHWCKQMPERRTLNAERLLKWIDQWYDDPLRSGPPDKHLQQTEDANGLKWCVEAMIVFIN